MAEEAKKNLDAAKDAAAAKFKKVAELEASKASAAAADREVIAGQIEDFEANGKQELGDAVATMHRTMLALKYQTEAKIKKTNTKIDAYGQALKKEVSDVNELMKAEMAQLTEAVEKQEEAAATTIA